MANKGKVKLPPGVVEELKRLVRDSDTTGILSYAEIRPKIAKGFRLIESSVDGLREKILGSISENQMPDVRWVEGAAQNADSHHSSPQDSSVSPMITVSPSSTPASSSSCQTPMA